MSDLVLLTVFSSVVAPEVWRLMLLNTGHLLSSHICRLYVQTVSYLLSLLLL
jgi:hypothetical protein